jgi:hypothetical protein
MDVLNVKSKLTANKAELKTLEVQELTAKAITSDKMTVQEVSANNLSAQTIVSNQMFISADSRSKENIAQYNRDALLNSLKALNAYTYSNSADPQKKRTSGLIAQEVQALFPELVNIDKNGTMGVDYNAISAIAAVAVGQLSNKVDSLQANFTVKDAGGTLYVNLPKFQVSNLTAERIEAQKIKTTELEAERAKIKELEAQNIKANNTKSTNVEAEKVNSGQTEMYLSLGLPMTAFNAVNNGHYLVNTSSDDGSYSTATVFVNNGAARIVPISSQGIEVLASGTQVQLLAAGKKVKVSWIRMS